MLSIDPLAYSEQLDEKIEALQTLFSGLPTPDLEIHRSQPSNYRMRAEFRIWHENGEVHFAMNQPGEKRPYIIKNFPPGSVLINQLMGLILPTLNASTILSKRLFSIEFLTTLSGEAIITLIYHRKLDEQWQQEAEQLHADLGASIIGRSRKQKLVVGRDYVLEKLQVAGCTYHYQQVETGFTQPNAGVNEQMLGWALDCSTDFSGDLLELYCGNGNFTCVLAQRFQKVLATEVAKVSVRSAAYNLQANAIKNVSIVRMSSEEITEAINRVRPFRRLKEIDLDSYNFSSIFVDPPRSGLDPASEQLAARFDNILYISCNPQTLHSNLQGLCRTHSIKRFAAFDQFPYTQHLECGVWLQRTPQ